MRALLITALFLVLGCGAADALDAAKVEAVTRASEQFVALAKGSHLTGHPPRQNDAAVKPLLDLLFDVSEVQQSSGTYKIADFNNLNAWNRAVLKAGLVYVLAGTGVEDLDKLGNDDATLQKVDDNAAAFAPETGRYFDAQLWLMVGLMDIFNNYMPGAPKDALEKPAFQNALLNFRAGATQTLDGMLNALVNRALADGWRRERMEVLTAAAARAAKFLLPDQKVRLRDIAVGVAKDMRDPVVKAKLTAIAETLKPR